MNKRVVSLSVGIAALIVGAIMSGTALEAGGPIVKKKDLVTPIEELNPVGHARNTSAGHITPVPFNYATGFEPEQGFTARDATCFQDTVNCPGGYTGECGFIGDGTQGSGPYPEPWAASASNRDNIEGHIDDVHPFSGTQHLRISHDACDDFVPFGFSVDARIPASPPQPGPIAPATFTGQIAIDGLFGANVFWQPQGNSQGGITSRALFYFYGWFYFFDDYGEGLTYTPVFTSWDASGAYHEFSVHHDPCAHYICIDNGYGTPLGVGPGGLCPNGNIDCRECVGGENDGMGCIGSFMCPGGQCDGGDCVGRIDYTYAGQPLFTTTTFGTTTSEQFLVYTDNYPSDVQVDLDDVVIETGEPCPSVCGNLEVERGEECDGINDGYCPGACVAPGDTGPLGETECTCVRPGTTCETATPLVNGTQTGGISHGGWWTFVADTPAYAIETCGTETHDTGIFAITGTCNTLEIILFNDDCDDNTYGYGENADPLASCYAIGGIRSPYESCACIATNIGQQYWIYEARNGLGREAVMTLTKRLDCGTVWDNGACCDRLTGTCTDDVAEADCTGPGLAWTLNKLCDSAAVSCVPATGACCDRSPDLGGVCTEGVLFADCQGANLVWTIDAICADVTCTEVRGACCDGLTGNCANAKLRSGCQGQSQLWSPNQFCADVTCDPVPGACCDHINPDPLSRVGVCTNGVVMADCQGENHTWTKSVTCTQVTCEAWFQAIPTMSEWGLVVLALTLLVAAKLWFGFARRPLISAA